MAEVEADAGATPLEASVEAGVGCAPTLSAPPDDVLASVALASAETLASGGLASVAGASVVLASVGTLAAGTSGLAALASGAILVGTGLCACALGAASTAGGATLGAAGHSASNCAGAAGSTSITSRGGLAGIGASVTSSTAASRTDAEEAVVGAAGAVEMSVLGCAAAVVGPRERRTMVRRTSDSSVCGNEGAKHGAPKAYASATKSRFIIWARKGKDKGGQPETGHGECPHKKLK